ncbi:T9SS type A sorting domain-containing protein [Polaribacter sp. BAL334]|uniref:T9SS type A sorting domain-containing protein n=1 Tax=Polaribacter sp. BAL334 TaxID=1708178 RepID=UPI0018D25259|nr:T9SS type A sorting domain-containing protein [Polaribacter sp. BAL334]MBG7613634.1 T9SS type A sorting domain-containing protein [Polaribacter sp. BAL334]
MKKTTIILIFIVLSVVLYKITSTKNNHQNLQEKHLALIKNHPLQNTLQLSKEERLALGIPPNKYFEEKYLLEINPKTGRTHPENIYKVQQDLKELRKLQQRTPGDGIDNSWIERGPNNVGGRTRMVLFDPNDVTHKRVFAGGVSGGLWVNNDITDENSSWTRVGIDENLSVTCMAVDPNNSQIMYLGTGEVHTPDQALGNGIWKSIDGGNTWTNVYKVRGVTTEGFVPGTYYVNDIIVRDADGNSATTHDSEVFAAIGAAGYSRNPIDTYLGFNEYGIYKSTNNGNNWNKITLDVDGTTVAPNDFEIGIDNTLWLATRRNVFGLGGGRIYSSSDGNTFTLKHSIPNARRTEIAVSKQNANTLYVLARVATFNEAQTAFIDPFVSILKTTNAFETSPTILALPDDADLNIPPNDFTRGQAFYNLTVEIDPTNDEIAYVGGIDFFRTTDSGTSWTQITKWSNNNNLNALNVPLVHADQHTLVFHPTDANKAIIGNDGGVYYATSLSTASSNPASITERNKEYNITQFYHSAIGASIDTENFLGGTQDNGTQFFDNPTIGINNSNGIFGGDGTYSFIDKEGTYMIATYLYNRIVRFNLPYTSGSQFTISKDSNTGDFVNVMDLDENLDILYTNGTTHLARFSNITTNSPTRTTISNALLTNISAIKVSPFTTNSSTVFVGTKTGILAKVENANTATQTITNISGDSFLGSISSIEFGTNENEILVTFHNFGVTSIWFSEDGGDNWTNKEGDLPDFPVKCILMNPLNNDEVIIGTELGIWNTKNFKDDSPNWHQSYNGMSNVAVTSLSLRTADYTILASSYGRGLYTGKFTANPLTTWTGTIDSDWQKSGNWSNGLPSNTIDAKIPNTVNSPVINSLVIVANLSIETNATVTLTPQASVTVKENVTNNGNLIINSSVSNSGSFIVEGTASGNITYNRYVTTNWHLTSSPVINQVYNNDWVSENFIASGTINPTQKGIAIYNNNTGSWQYMMSGNTATFLQGEGYSTLRTSQGNLRFSGAIVTTNTTKSISKGTNNAFNLLGNVYTSFIPLNIDADGIHNFLTTNANLLDEITIWLWNGTSYNAINHASNAVFIAPGQGFFVKSKPEGGNVLFSKLMQSHQTFNFLKQQTKPAIKVFLSDGTIEKQTDIFYISNATIDFDNGFDSTLYSGIASNLEIYTKIVGQNQNSNLSIQSIPKDYFTVIPIGINAPANKSISIRFESKNMDENIKVYLEDRALGIYTLMNDFQKKYTFKSGKNLHGSGRFFIHTSSETLGTTKNNVSNSSIYYKDAKIYFSGLPSGKKTIKVYDILGKLLIDEKITLQSFISVDKRPKAAYIVHILTEKGTLQKKMIFH